jgi:hypothetical protein
MYGVDWWLLYYTEACFLLFLYSPIPVLSSSFSTNLLLTFFLPKERKRVPPKSCPCWMNCSYSAVALVVIIRSVVLTVMLLRNNPGLLCLVSLSVSLSCLPVPPFALGFCVSPFLNPGSLFPFTLLHHIPYHSSLCPIRINVVADPTRIYVSVSAPSWE